MCVGGGNETETEAETEREQRGEVMYIHNTFSLQIASMQIHKDTRIRIASRWAYDFSDSLEQLPEITLGMNGIGLWCFRKTRRMSQHSADERCSCTFVKVGIHKSNYCKNARLKQKIPEH